MKQTREKIDDYHNFSTVLVAISVFFYLGLMFTGDGKTPEQIFLLLCTAYVFLRFAFIFRIYSLNLFAKILQDD
ncbi:MAG: YrhC family protein [Caldibacillus sp.]